MTRQVYQNIDFVATDQLSSRLVAKFEDRAVSGDARLTTFYRSERATFVGAGCWHMLSWLACAAEVWLLLRLMGAAISCGDALIIEGLAQPIRAAAIIVPGALGVQESGGVAVCSWLGIGLDVSVAVWLVRRAREPVGSTGCPSWKNARRGALAAAEVAPQRAAIYPTLTVRSRPGGSVRPAPEQDRPPSAAGGAS